MRTVSVIEKSVDRLGQERREKRSSDHDVESYKLLSSVVNALDEGSDFIVDQKESFQKETKKISKIPSTTQINEVVVNKLKITEAREIIFKDQDQNTYSTWGQIGYEDDAAAASNPHPKQADAFVQDTQKIEAEKLTYLRKTIRDQNKYFFKVKNHNEFYQVGKSFQEDYQKGQKFFLFANLGARADQQRTILGIASFFQYFEQMKVLIISSQLNSSFFHNILKDAPMEKLCISTKHTNTAQFIFHNEMTFLDAHSLKEQKATNTLNYEGVFDYLHHLFDCILYDLPDVSKDKDHLDFYFPIYKRADSVSLIFLKNSSSFTGVESMMKQFQSYGVRIKGALLAEQKGVKSEK